MKLNTLSESLHESLKSITEEMEEINDIESMFYPLFPLEGLQIKGKLIEGSIYRRPRRKD